MSAMLHGAGVAPLFPKLFPAWPTSRSATSLRVVNAAAARRLRQEKVGFSDRATFASCFAAVAASMLLTRGRRASRSRTERNSDAVALRAVEGSVETFIINGTVDVSTLSMKCARISAHMDLSAVVFLSLGVSEEIITSAAGGALGLHGACPVFIADCHGIIGFDEFQKKNIELMGSDVGGNGGAGVVVVAFRGKAYTTTIGEGGVTNLGESHLLIGSSDAKYEQTQSGAVYGGRAQKCFVIESSTGVLREIASFAVSGDVTSAVGTFSGDAGVGAQGIVQSLPSMTGVNAAGYFPCYSKGFNKYGSDGVEPGKFTGIGMQKVRLFGMFPKGTFGPPEGYVLAGGDDLFGSIGDAPVEEQFMVSVLALLKDC
ncbi:unnamed protein product [Polarella glacialis]|uniref:Uncharacterized protein n=1 Tax=Polarella glacialis TaxID=89957 RepID=A0A813EFL5_POLGL|nr:unnamed protein product [Polarella glacialis]